MPVVASYGMTSGYTPPEGITAPMLFYDPAHPPVDAQIAGKILVFQTAQYPDPPYTNAFLDSLHSHGLRMAFTGQMGAVIYAPLHERNQFLSFSLGLGSAQPVCRDRHQGTCRGMVVVYDLSPGAAFGLAQRSVYTPDGKAGLGADYINCPTLTLDRVNGAKVLVDAKAGKIGHPDTERPLPARHRQSDHRLSAGTRTTARSSMSRFCLPHTPMPCP